MCVCFVLCAPVGLSKRSLICAPCVRSRTPPPCRAPCSLVCVCVCALAFDEIVDLPARLYDFRHCDRGAEGGRRMIAQRTPGGGHMALVVREYGFLSRRLVVRVRGSHALQAGELTTQTMVWCGIACARSASPFRCFEPCGSSLNSTLKLSQHWAIKA